MHSALVEKVHKRVKWGVKGPVCANVFMNGPLVGRLGVIAMVITVNYDSFDWFNCIFHLVCSIFIFGFWFLGNSYTSRIYWKQSQGNIDLINTHTSERLFSCSKCEERFAQEAELSKHEQTHSSDKPFSSSQCEESLICAAGLSEHERAHTSEEPFSCSKCEERFALEADLSEHERIHISDKPFSCSICEESFVQDAELREHERAHTCDKPFKCSQCEERFNQAADLKEHEQSHTSDKPFSCSHCEEKLANDIELSEHEMIHINESHSADPNVTRGLATEQDYCNSCNQKKEQLSKKYSD